MTEEPSKREVMREERRRQILEAALAVFSQKGFHATNVSDVAAQAGVSQGTIYWYFESKEELFEAAILSVFDQIGSEAMAGIFQHETATGKLRALTDTMAGLGELVENVFMLFLGYWASSPRRGEAAKEWIEILVGYKDLIASLIEEGVRDGEFRPVDADALAWMLMAAYDGLAAYLMLAPDLDVKQISTVFIDTLLKGLAVDEE